MAEQHLAYPVLHYFHTGDRDASAPVSIATLDDALLLLATGVSPEARPAGSAVEPLHRAIARYLTIATSTSQTPGHPDSPPPPPSLQPLGAADIPVVTEPEFREAVRVNARRRSELRELVHSNGWSWPELQSLRLTRSAYHR
jgi:hypothetical protein